jgi:GNAT superfamily N-acetyltransferase
MDLPSSQSVVTIRDITADNWEQVCALVVNKDQVQLLPSNLTSLCEHQFHTPQSIVRAIYADNVPVGYIRLFRLSSDTKDEEEEEEEGRSYRLLSFMIDQHCQGLGFGSRALKILFVNDAIVLKSIRISTTTFSTVRKDDSPACFFETFGFQLDPSSSDLVWTS